MKRLFLIFLAFMGCSKIDEDGFRTFKIKKGKHRSVYRYKSDYRNYIEFDVIFNESAIYSTKLTSNQFHFQISTNLSSKILVPKN